ncbi:MAG: ABC transporter ATP-binding protein [Candidatus Heimdallarchaeota archaeon]|nr:ABC transporter ATP-binding protein [Candidatus Heimdallarchaeota archaeon]
MSVISVEGVSKSYKQVIALDNISFEVEENTIFGFLGPNGAGKSTTIAILNQLLYADSGKVMIFGENIKGNTEIKQRIGLIPDADLPRISGVKLLKHTARYHGYQGQTLRQQVSDIVKLTETRDFVSRNTSTLSKGQKTRIKIANALISNPDLIIADEPTSGLDPVARKQFHDITRSLVKDQGKSVFFSSHVIGEVEKLCDQILILNKGKVITQGTLSNIHTFLPGSNSFSLNASGLLIDDLQNLPGVSEVQKIMDDRFTVYTSNSGNSTPGFLKAIIDNPGVIIHSFMRERMDLERVFLDAINKEGEDH